MNYADIFNALVLMLASNVWPLTGLLIALLILKKIKDDVRPIFLKMVDPLARQAQSNAVAWAVGILLAILSMLGALTEVAQQQGWVWVGIACKVLGPPIATIVALTRQSPANPPPPPTGATTYPFQTPAGSDAPRPNP